MVMNLIFLLSKFPKEKRSTIPYNDIFSVLELISHSRKEERYNFSLNRFLSHVTTTC